MAQSNGFNIEAAQQWLQKEDFPFEATIREVLPVPGKYGVDARLTLEAANGTIRHFDAWGKNKNALVYQFGGATAEWIGKRVLINIDEQTGYRVLHVVLAGK